MPANPRSVPTVPVRSPFDRARHATFWTLLIGYGAYYLCRSNISVASVALQNELHYSKGEIGKITGVATLFYALGKFTLGPAADLLGGKRIFLGALAVSIVANVAFGASTGLFVFVVIWSINRFAQSPGWMGMVQLVGRWYERGRYGVVMAWLSISYLVGDVVSRAFGASLLRLGVGWRGLFFAPAIVCTVFLIVASRTLSTPPTPAPATETSHEAAVAEPSFRDILSLLVKSRGFWTACVLSLLLTFLRTAFLDWTSLYFVDSGASEWSAALQSAAFPAAGVAGTLFIGWYSDRVAGARRGPIMSLMLGALVVVLALLVLVGKGSPILASLLIAASGFLLLGPYSLPAGCLALDYGGKRAAATAAGLADGIGYLGGSASGLVLGALIDAHGWTFAFVVFAAAGAVALAVAIFFTVFIEPSRPAPS